MKSLDGVFIRANDDQLAAIWNACALHGFTLDSEGILKLLMLAVDPPEDEDEDDEELGPPTLAEMIQEHLAANPAQAEALRNAGAKLFSSVASKFKKG